MRVGLLLTGIVLVFLVRTSHFEDRAGVELKDGSAIIYNVD